MELEPTSEGGNRLYTLCRNWIINSPAIAQDILKRIFLAHASDIVNPDAFLDALYGQRVLTESHYWTLVYRIPPQKLTINSCPCMQLQVF